MEKLDGSLNGKTEKEAVEILEAKEIPYRVVERDGKVTGFWDEINPDRINLVLKDGLVVAYWRE